MSRSHPFPGMTSAVAVALLLTGCGATEVDGNPSASRPSPPTVETPTPTPTVDPAQPPSSGPVDPASELTCDSLLTDAEEERVLSERDQGLILLENFEQKLRDENSPERLFFEFGGIACLWGYEGTDNVDIRGFSTLNESQAAKAQAELTGLGFTASTEGAGTVYTPGAGNELGYDEAYVFTTGAWYFALEPDGRASIRAELVD